MALMINKTKKVLAGAAISLTLPALLTLLALISMTGCSSDTSTGDLSQEKIAYIADDGSSGSVRFNPVDGGASHGVLQWAGLGERLTFSGDGKYFALSLGDKKETMHSLIAATDGSAAWHLPRTAVRPSFSPDGTKVAFTTRSAGSGTGGDGASRAGVLDLTTGKLQFLVDGVNLDNASWIDNSTFIYDNTGGQVNKVDIETGEKIQLTPAGMQFTSYSYPVSYIRKKLVLTQFGDLYQHNIWSLDLESGALRKITANELFHYRAGYLPGSNDILFTEQQFGDRFTSELCQISDDGSFFRMLTSDFDYDGTQTVSPSSGKLAYKHTDQVENASWEFMPGKVKVTKPTTTGSSIWVINPDGTGRTQIAGSDTDSLSDPCFVTAPGWNSVNPLKLSVAGGPSGSDSFTVTIENPGSVSIDSVLRALPGADLKLSSMNGSEPEAATDGPAGQLQWRLELGPGEKREINLSVDVNKSNGAGDLATMLFTLNVDGAFPLMYWQDCG